MPRIVGVDLPRDKPIHIALTYIHGIGRPTAARIVAEAGLDPGTRVRDITEQDAAKLREIIDRDYTVEGEKRREIHGNIQRLIEIGSYRGTRHRRGLPVRGQRTKTNARTRKGPKRTVAGRRKAPGPK